MKYSFFSCLLITVFISSGIKAQLRLPAVIGSSMVLQQNDSVNIWGWAGPAEKVFVTTGWDNRKDSAVTSSGAMWNVKVKTPSAGGPYTITISSTNTIQLDDVMIGEVWVCSGQSNMEWSYLNGVADMSEEIAAAPNKNIRLFQIPKTTSIYPQDDVKASWVVSDSNSLKNFSAVGYFFGKKLQQDLNVPVGIINASWGGTPAEAWTPVHVIEDDNILKQAADKLNTVDWWPVKPALAYNGMIAPITPFRIAGSIWYQGESNTRTNSTYKKLFTGMIDAWRDAWDKDFPFYYVQIAPYNYGENNVGALLQEAQTQTMSHPKTGMVVITDLIDSVTNIHPSRKREVGNRLANWALAETYHKNNIEYKSPAYKDATKVKNRMLLSFDNVPAGFRAPGTPVSGFYISGTNEEWVPANAKIEKDKIVVWSKQVKEPVFVRYGFGNTIVGNVMSAGGLPLTPFRTDKFNSVQ